MVWKKFFALCLLLLVSVSVGAAAAERARTTHDLGTLGRTDSQGDALNDAGQVIGVSATAVGVNHGFIWSNGVMTDLGTLGGNYTSPRAINNRGEVVGSSSTALGRPHAFLWKTGVMHDLGILPGEWGSEPAAINDRGQIVGSSLTGTGLGRAVVWDQGVIKDLDVTGISVGAGINNHGLVVGSHATTLTFDLGWLMRAFVWQDGKVEDLGTLGFRESTARFVNDQGQVVGLLTNVGTVHAFFWDGAMTDLGTLGGDVAVATGLNARGFVCGYSSIGNGETHAFVWHDGRMSDLGPGEAVAINDQNAILIRRPDRLGVLDHGQFTEIGPVAGGSPTSVSGYAINKHGDVAGWATTATGATHAILWSR